MTKKKKGFASKFIRNAAARVNPGEAIKSSGVYKDALTYIAPAVVGYAATRSVGRLARNILGSRFENPVFIKPIQIAGNVASLVLLWYMASKIKSLHKYKNGLVAGAGTAVVQSLVEFIMPKLNFLFDAPSPRAQIDRGSDEEEDLAEYEEISNDRADSASPDADGEEDAEDFNTGVFSN